MPAPHTHPVFYSVSPTTPRLNASAANGVTTNFAVGLSQALALPLGDRAQSASHVAHTKRAGWEFSALCMPGRLLAGGLPTTFVLCLGHGKYLAPCTQRR